MTDQEISDYAEQMLFSTRSAIENDAYTVEGLLRALARHGVAVWQIGQRGDDWTWDCQLSHKAAWGDVFYKATHCATLDAAVRAAAREWSDTR